MDWIRSGERWDGRWAACSPLVVIIVVLCVVVLARVDTWLHGELLQYREAEGEITQHSSEKDIRRRAAAAYRVSIQQIDYNPCELRKAGVFLPQVSAEMASAVAVAAKV